MKELLKQFEVKDPEIKFEWNDQVTEAKGWVIINSLRGGAAGGGTRMRKGLDQSEVEALAKTMEIKFTVSGPSIGGAKSGIDFDPHDVRKDGVLKRWLEAVTPLLKTYYGTGGDLNVDEVNEVIPYTEGLGLWHPQEGVVNGHYHPSDAEKIRKLGQLRMGVSKVVEDPNYTPSIEKKFKIADLITGYGVAKSVIHYYKLWGGTLAEKRAIIQGWGNVGAAAGYYLAQSGVKIVGIIDKNGGLLNTEGFKFSQIRELLLSKSGNELHHPDKISFTEIEKAIWTTGAEIFIPAAASRIVSESNLDDLVRSGLEVIAAGANVPFKDRQIFYGPIAEKADNAVSVVPDFIANCGMARVFAYLMGASIELTDEALFQDTSKTIYDALCEVHSKNSHSTKLVSTALEIALKKLI